MPLDARAPTPTTVEATTAPAGACRPNRWPTTPPSPTPRAGRAEEAPELHGGLRRRAHRARPRRTAASSGSRRACRPAPACPSSPTAFPDRVFDVGIAEQHAVTLATGLAMGGMRPVVALYSTFLQRAFDQTVHDVCQNDQPVLLAVDRAGLVGEDGTSHQGMFTLPAQRQLPNLVIASPKDEQELRSLLRTALAQDHPFALHYPRDAGLRAARRRAGRPAGRAGRDAARGPRPAVRRLRADRRAGARGRRRPRGRGLVGRRHQRPVRQAARPAAHPRRGARQAAGRDVRGERRDRRVRQRRARAHRRGAPGRSGLPRRARSGSSASRATGSSTTARWRTCAACCASTPPGLADQVRETLATLAADAGPVRLRASPGRLEPARAAPTATRATLRSWSAPSAVAPGRPARRRPVACACWSSRPFIGRLAARAGGDRRWTVARAAVAVRAVAGDAGPHLGLGRDRVLDRPR